MFETLPGGVRTSRLDWNLPEVTFYIPEVISEVYTRCTEHWGPPKVNRIAKVQVVVEIFKNYFPMECKLYVGIYGLQIDHFTAHAH